MAEKKKTPRKAKREETPPVEASTGYMQQIAEITLRPSSQYLFVSDRGVQIADGITLELGGFNCEDITVIRTDTKHVTEVVQGLVKPGDKIKVNAVDFGESETLLFTANGKTAEGFAISTGASLFRIPLAAAVQVPEDDMAAQAALVDDYFNSLNKPAIAIMKDTGIVVNSSTAIPTPPGVGTTIALGTGDRTTFTGADKRTWAVTDTGDVLVFDDVSGEFVRVDDEDEILDNLHVPREKLVGIFLPRSVSPEIEKVIQEADDCEDCEIDPKDKPTEIWSPVAQAQLLDWEEITDELSRVYVWAERDLTIQAPRALFYKKDPLGVTTVVLDAQNVVFEIPPGYQFLIRHRRT